MRRFSEKAVNVSSDESEEEDESEDESESEEASSFEEIRMRMNYTIAMPVMRQRTGHTSRFVNKREFFYTSLLQWSCA